jgi:hypothetical protein
MFREASLLPREDVPRRKGHRRGQRLRTFFGGYYLRGISI